MRYLIALVCPPLAILLCGKPVLALLCIPICVFYFPAALIALLIVAGHNAEISRRRSMDNAIDVFAQAIVNIARPDLAQYQQHKTASNEEKVSFPILIFIGMAFIIYLSMRFTFRLILATPSLIIASAVLVRQFVIYCKEASIVAYKNLPEWAQPITWGLAAGTPISIILILVITLRR